jgi:hypothetical protein
MYPVTFDQTYPIAATRARPRQHFDTPANYSEENIAAWSAMVRGQEDVPPEVPDIPVGSWRWYKSAFPHPHRDSGYIELSVMEVLLELPIGALDLVEDWQDRFVIEKYAEWIVNTGTYPPIAVTMYMKRRRLQVRDGHHRVKALLALGHETVRCWVNMSYFDEVDSYERELTWEKYEELYRDKV